MIDFVKLQKLMKEQLEIDRTIRIVNTEGQTLESALEEASTLLDVPVRRIEYEVIERGFKGILGTGKKEWKIRAYARILTQATKTSTGSESVDEEAVSLVAKNTSGEVFVRLSPNGVLLKVKPPVGSGRPATTMMAMQALNDRFVKDIDANMVSAVVEHAEDVYIKVGTFNRNYSHDSN
ncbi:MAG: Jag N-terminal domain-containing protein, partial [Treponema sp.]|nr:Jag N-terminal domain-containing protein [Treponema sp.]